MPIKIQQFVNCNKTVQSRGYFLACPASRLHPLFLFHFAHLEQRQWWDVDHLCCVHHGSIYTRGWLGGGGGKEVKYTCKLLQSAWKPTWASTDSTWYIKGYYNSIDAVPAPSPVALRLLTAVICPLRSYPPIDTAQQIPNKAPHTWAVSFPDRDHFSRWSRNETWKSLVELYVWLFIWMDLYH